MKQRWNLQSEKKKKSRGRTRNSSCGKSRKTHLKKKLEIRGKKQERKVQLNEKLEEKVKEAQRNKIQEHNQEKT